MDFTFIAGWFLRALPSAFILWVTWVVLHRLELMLLRDRVRRAQVAMKLSRPGAMFVVIWISVTAFWMLINNVGA